MTTPGQRERKCQCDAPPRRTVPLATRAPDSAVHVSMSDMESIDFLAQLVRTRRFTLGVPHQFTVTPDESAALFLRSRAGDDPVTCLWAVDLGSGKECMLADPAELPGHEQANEHGGGIASYAASQGTGLVAFTLAGELWVVDVA